MKKIIIMLAITISSLAAFAGEENVNKKVLNAFSQEFAGAKDVNGPPTTLITKHLLFLTDNMYMHFTSWMES